MNLILWSRSWFNCFFSWLFINWHSLSAWPALVFISVCLHLCSIMNWESNEITALQKIDSLHTLQQLLYCMKVLFYFATSSSMWTPSGKGKWIGILWDRREGGGRVKHERWPCKGFWSNDRIIICLHSRWWANVRASNI